MVVTNADSRTDTQTDGTEHSVSSACPHQWPSWFRKGSKAHGKERMGSSTDAKQGIRPFRYTKQGWKGKAWKEAQGEKSTALVLTIMLWI